MSIDKRGASFFKVREDLNGLKTARRNIKVLTDLSIPRGPACYRHSGPNGPEEGCLFGCCIEQAKRTIGLMSVARFFCCLKQAEQDERGLGAAQRL